MTWTFTKRPGHLPNDLDIYWQLLNVQHSAMV